MATRQKNIEAHEFCRMLQEQYINVEFISGKWFLNGVEYELTSKDGLYNRLCSISEWMAIKRNRKAFVDYMTEVQGQPDGDWPEMAIVTKAKAKIREGYRPGELAYPLNEKELKIIHYLIDGDPKDNYAIFFHGRGKTGKSTVCNLISQLFGRYDVSTVSFTDIGNSFKRETLAGKRLWYDPEISPYFSDHSSHTFKKIITGDYDQFEKKGQDPYDARYRCKGLFCCNVAPKFDISDSGLLRRIIYYFKDTVIENANGDLQSRIWTEQELLDIAIAALLTDISDLYDTFKHETREIIMKSNSVGKYGMAPNIGYEQYVEECYRAGIRQVFAKDKFMTMRALFQGWKDEREEELRKECQQFVF